MRRAKAITTMLCENEDIPNMEECSEGYCLFRLDLRCLSLNKKS